MTIRISRGTQDSLHSSDPINDLGCLSRDRVFQSKAANARVESISWICRNRILEYSAIEMIFNVGYRPLQAMVFREGDSLRDPMIDQCQAAELALEACQLVQWK